MVASLALAAAGCLSRPALVRQDFAFQSPPPAPASSNATVVLAIRSFTVAPQFEGRSLVYRIGAESYEQDPRAALMVPARAALEVPVRAWLRNSDSIRDVIEPGSLLQSNRSLEVHVSDFYGDLRDPGHPAAVLDMRFTFFRLDGGSPPVPFLQKRYARRIEVSVNSAASIVSGWNQALSEIMTEVLADLSASKLR